MHDQGLEVRHTENLREHYSLTLREWGANLERHWADAVAEVGQRRARTWRLYMAYSRVGFDLGRIQVHQMLGVRPHQGGRSGMPLRPDWQRGSPRSAERAARAQRAVVPGVCARRPEPTSAD
jgi:cyclopropane-fatty-acyl-phospholipid synthase